MRTRMSGGVGGGLRKGAPYPDCRGRRKRMSNDKNQPTNDPDLAKVEAALKRAARRAREIAIRTNTQLVVFENGRVVRKTPD